MFRSLVRRAGGAASGGERCDVLVWSARIHSRMTAPPAPSFRVVALLSAYNEADVIGETIGALIGDGVEVPREPVVRGAAPHLVGPAAHAGAGMHAVAVVGNLSTERGRACGMPPRFSSLHRLC